MSRPNRVRVLLILAFALTLAAGVVAGIGFARATPGVDVGGQPVPPPPAAPQPDRNWMADQLKLDPRQRELVTNIWRDAPHDKVRELDARRRALFREREDALAALYTPQQKADRDKAYRAYEAKVAEVRRERDDAVAALYTPEQKTQREQLLKEFAAKSAEVSKEKDKLLQPMVDRTRLVLNEEQRKRFDGLIARGGGPDRGGGERGGDRGGHRGGPPGVRSGTGPSTMPTDHPWPEPGGFRGDRGGDHPPPPPPL
jgi:hypothetical protein